MSDIERWLAEAPGEEILEALEARMKDLRAELADVERKVRALRALYPETAQRRNGAPTRSDEVKALLASTGPSTAADLRRATGMDNNLYKILNPLMDRGQVVRVERGVYALADGAA